MFQFPAPQAAGPADPIPVPFPFLAPPVVEEHRHGNPRWEITAGLGVVGVFAAATLAWATMVPLDAAVVAPGTVKVSGERQKIQADGQGAISAIRVENGEHVRAGQPLIDFAAPDLVAAERSFASRVIALQAEIAGLEAEEAGSATITSPPEFGAYAGEDAALAAAALKAESLTLTRRRAAARAAQSVLGQRLAEVRDQTGGTTVQADAVRQQRDLMNQEVTSVRALAAKGYASRNRVLELERSEAELTGSSGTVTAELAKLRSSIGEARMAIVQADSDRRQASVMRLRDARAELQSLLPQWAGARQQLARMQVRAPVSGTVMGLTVHTIGGVAERGQTLVEIVPADRALTIEAQAAATDGNEVKIGKTALLRLPGLHGRGVPALHGTVVDVAADVQTDEKTGRGYYPIRVRVLPDELDRLAKALGTGTAGVLRPGNPVQVVIATRPRSALQYWLDPITQTVAGALHER